MLDQAESLRKLMNQKDSGKVSKTKIITISSGKGGVGKSNFVVNLGITLQKMGKKVLIFDADIGMANDDVIMGVSTKYNVFDIIKNKAEIDQVIVTGHYGIKLLPGGSGLNNVEDLNERERENFLSKLEALTDFDYILMDTGAGINRSVLAFISCCDDLIVLTTPEPTSLTDAYSLMKAATHFKLKDRASVVINRAYDEDEGEETFKKFQYAVNKFLKIPLIHLGTVFEDRKLVQAVKEQRPVTIAYPNSEVAKSIEAIAKKLVGIEGGNNAGVQGLFKKIFKIFS